MLARWGIPGKPPRGRNPQVEGTRRSVYSGSAPIEEVCPSEREVAGTDAGPADCRQGPGFPHGLTLGSRYVSP